MRERIKIISNPENTNEERTDMDFAKLKRFADLTERKKAIEAEEKAIKAEMDALEPVIIEEMMDEGLQNANINGRTYYINRRLFAGPDEATTKPAFPQP
jgi:hypothetical protein